MQPISTPVPHYLNVVASGGASTPDQPAMNSGTGTIDISAKLALANWASGASQSIFSQRDASANARTDFLVTSTGALQLTWFTAGPTNNTQSSSVTLGLSANAVKWVRAVQNMGTAKCDFYTSDDGVTWTQLGVERSTNGNALQTVGTPQLVKACNDNFNIPAIGKCYRTTLILGGVTILDQDWSVATPGSGPWVSGSGETWTALGSSTVLAS